MRYPRPIFSATPLAFLLSFLLLITACNKTDDDTKIIIEPASNAKKKQGSHFCHPQ